MRQRPPQHRRPRLLAARVAFPVGILFLLASASPTSALQPFQPFRPFQPFQAVQFVEVAQSAGVSYLQADFSAPPGLELPYMTGGAAAGDCDGDGWVDLFVTRLDASDILFRNRGEDEQGLHRGFENVSSAAFGTQLPSEQTNGCAWGDVDHDGDLDLYLTNVGGLRYHLFVNDGTGRFTEEAETRGAALSSPFAHRGWSVGFGDYDCDGYLDLYATEWGNLNVNPGGVLSHARLLRNLGAVAPGHFEDTTLAAGVSIDDSIGIGPNNSFAGVFAFSVNFADLDRDGHPDLLITGDFSTSRLFWNDGDGTFSDGTQSSGVATDENGMGHDVGDYDGDGDLDIFVSSIDDPLASCEGASCNWGYSGNRLYRNDGARGFSDQTDAAGVRAGFWGWGSKFWDYDNDGDLDLVQTDGIDFPSTPLDDPYATDPTRLWCNRGDGTFEEVSASLGITDTQSGKGLLTFDYDRDGDLDLFIVNNGSQPLLYRNDGGNANHWLRVELAGEKSNTFGIGATVEVRGTAGGPSQVRQVSASNNFLGQSETALHFGLGPQSTPVARVEVRWPSGSRQVLKNVAIDSTLHLNEPRAQEIEAEPQPAALPTRAGSAPPRLAPSR